MNPMAMSLESNLIANNERADVLGTTFEAVERGLNIALCSDCCGSNGNSCDPSDQY